MNNLNGRKLKLNKKSLPAIVCEQPLTSALRENQGTTLLEKLTETEGDDNN